MKPVKAWAVLCHDGSINFLRIYRLRQNIPSHIAAEWGTRIARISISELLQKGRQP